jgi:hypothetical protein
MLSQPADAFDLGKFSLNFLYPAFAYILDPRPDSLIDKARFYGFSHRYQRYRVPATTALAGRRNPASYRINFLCYLHLMGFNEKKPHAYSKPPE